MHTILRALLLLGICGAWMHPFAAFAQEAGDISGYGIASSYHISDPSVSYGDIISYDKKEDVYDLARVKSDGGLFGVAVEYPLLVYQAGTGTIPVIESGRAMVNVSTLNGPIARGDYITSSMLPGKGQKAVAGDMHVIGIARAAFDGTRAPATTTVAGRVVAIGQVPAILTVGTNDAAGVAAEEERFTEATILNIIQYLVAAFVAVGSVYIAFRNFMPNLDQGVVSIGRNPRAKSSIQAMVLLNAALIILVSAAGILLGVAIILLPL